MSVEENCRRQMRAEGAGAGPPLSAVGEDLCPPRHVPPTPLSGKGGDLHSNQ